MELIVFGALGLFAIWIANASQGVQDVVEEKTGNESTGNGCGWLLFIVLFLAFVVLFPVALVATFPEDCPTIAINRAMGRCP